MTHPRRSLHQRLLASARFEPSETAGVEESLAWLDAHARSRRFEVEPVGLDRLAQWRADPSSGDLAHRSGRFFGVCGVRVHSERQVHDQPILVQPEDGILGVIAREMDGQIHFLLQAKAEPGNPGLWQLAPTVQATSSNYGRAHGGTAPALIERFLDSGARVLVDQSQPEHESVFLGKRNRNMVIEVPGEVAHDDLHRWFTLGQIKRLLALPCRVNMDSRTVLSCLPLAPAADGDDEETHRWLDTAAPPAPRLERIGLRALRGWRTDERVSSDDARGFSITGVRVRADCREVAGWDQPMVVATALGLVAFVTQRREDGLHVLVQACRGLGAVGGPLVGATVQRGAGSDLTATDDGSAFFEALVTSPPTGALRYDTVHAEEGGRFYHVKTVHRIVEIAPGEVIDCPPSHRWLSLPRLKRLVARGGVNIQARSLLACLHAIDDDGNEPA